MRVDPIQFSDYTGRFAKANRQEVARSEVNRQPKIKDLADSTHLTDVHRPEPMGMDQVQPQPPTPPFPPIPTQAMKFVDTVLPQTDRPTDQDPAENNAPTGIILPTDEKQQMQQLKARIQDQPPSGDHPATAQNTVAGRLYARNAQLGESGHTVAIA